MSTSYTAKGDEQGNPKQIYSTDEVLTGGVWIDGSPIYRKVILLNDIPAEPGDQYSINHNLDINKYLKSDFVLSSLNLDRLVILPIASVPFPANGTSFLFYGDAVINMASNVIEFGKIAITVPQDVYLILEYTKNP